MASRPRTSRTFTISLPPDLAAKAEFLAKRDSRTISELFREALRTYYTHDSRQSITSQAMATSLFGPNLTDTQNAPSTMST